MSIWARRGENGEGKAWPRALGEVFVDLVLIGLAFAVFFRGYIFFGHYIASRWLSEIVPEVWPHNEFLIRNLVDGTIPFWNPTTWLGIPFLAIPHTGVWYPANWLYLYGAFPDSLKWDQMGHLYLFGCFVYLLCRDMFGSRLGSIFSAFLAICGEQFLLHGFSSGNHAVLHTDAYIPLAFLFLRRLLMTGHGGWAIPFSMTLVLQIFGGYVQMFMYQLVCLGLFTVMLLAHWLLTGKILFKESVRRGALAVVGVLLAFSGAGIQLVPSYELLTQESVRSGGVGASFATQFAMTPAYPETLLTWGGNLSDRDEDALPVLGYGPTTSALIVLGLLFHFSRERFYLAALIVFATLFAMGESTPLFKIASHVPLLNSARVVSRIITLGQLFLTVLAGFGVSALLRSVDKGRMGRLFLVAVSLWSLGFALLPMAYYGMELLPVELLLLLPLVGVALAFSRHVHVGSVAVWLIVCLLVDTSIFFEGRIRETSSLETYRVHPGYMRWSQVRRDMDRTYLRTHIFPIFTPPLSPQVGLLTGDRMLNGKGPLPLKRFADLMDRAEGGESAMYDDEDQLVSEHVTRILNSRWVTPENRFILDLLNVRYILLHFPVPAPTPVYPAEMASVMRGTFTRLHIEGLRVLENPTAFPVAFTCHEVIVMADDDALLEKLFEADFDRRGVALTTTPIDVRGIGPVERSDEVHVTEYGTNHVEVEVWMDARGILVLTDMYYPGWKAIIDGEREEEVFAVDHVLRGVVVDKGFHRVRFEYRPTHFTGAIILSGGTVVVWVVWGMFLLIRRLMRGRGEGVAGETL